MTTARQRGTAFLFVANHPCLDFINTEMIRNGRLVDVLEEFSDLVAWFTQARILMGAEAKEAVRRWGGRPAAQRVLGEARALRATLREMVERIENGRPVPRVALDEINGLLRACTGYAELVRAQGRFTKRFHREFSEPVHLIVPLAELASDLLCHSDLSLIKRCENSACVLYFYDRTKNHTRRWCSMSACGNRIKVAAHYRRRRQSRVSQERRTTRKP